MQITTNEAKLPPEAMPVLQDIKKAGLPWDYAFDGKPPTLQGRLQVREIEEPAPRWVQQYRTAYERGDHLPPIVTTLDGHLVDGATRAAAAVAAGMLTMPMFRIKITYGTASESQKRALRAFGRAANNQHGKGMTRSENESGVRDLAAEGRTIKDIATELKVSEAFVSGVLAEDRGRQRLEQLGIRIEGGLKPSHVRELGYKDKQLTTPTRRALAELTRDAHLRVEDMVSICKQMAEQPDEDAKLAVLAQARVDYGSRIRPRNANAPRNSGKLRQAGGRVLALIDKDPGSAVEMNPDYVDDHVKMLLKIIDRCEKVLAEQQKNENTRNGVTAVPFVPFS